MTMEAPQNLNMHRWFLLAIQTELHTGTKNKSITQYFRATGK
jgi:hypothetical protein